jgi:ubiquinol-cytochrome c reductase cytochrome b subunit
VIVGVVVIHIWALHRFGSNNPLGIDTKGPQDTIPFHPYYTVKDMFGLGIFMLFYAFWVFFAPNALGDPANYIPANPLSTPEQRPNAFCRSMRSSIDPGQADGRDRHVPVDLRAFPAALARPRRCVRPFRPAFKFFFWMLVFDCAILLFVGKYAPEPCGCPSPSRSPIGAFHRTRGGQPRPRAFGGHQ